jgi:hypothetical protein
VAGAFALFVLGVLGMANDGFAEVGFAEVGFAEGGFAEVGFAEVGFAEVGFAEVGFAEGGLAEGGLAVVFFSEVARPLFLRAGSGFSELGPARVFRWGDGGIADDCCAFKR